MAEDLINLGKIDEENIKIQESIDELVKVSKCDIPSKITHDFGTKLQILKETKIYEFNIKPFTDEYDPTLTGIQNSTYSEFIRLLAEFEEVTKRQGDEMDKLLYETSNRVSTQYIKNLLDVLHRSININLYFWRWQMYMNIGHKILREQVLLAQKTHKENYELLGRNTKIKEEMKTWENKKKELEDLNTLQTQIAQEATKAKDAADEKLKEKLEIIEQKNKEINELKIDIARLEERIKGKEEQIKQQKIIESPVAQEFESAGSEDSKRCAFTIIGDLPDEFTSEQARELIKTKFKVDISEQKLDKYYLMNFFKKSGLTSKVEDGEAGIIRRFFVNRKAYIEAKENNPERIMIPKL